MNKNYSRFAMALVATTALVGVTQLADAGTLYMNPATVGGVGGFVTAASIADTNAQVNFAVDIFGSSNVAIGNADFDVVFQVANQIDQASERLISLAIDLGTYAAGSFGNTGVADGDGVTLAVTDGHTVTKIGGGIGTNNVLFQVTANSSVDIIVTDLIATEFKIDGLTAMATANTEITLSGELTLTSGTVLETDTLKIAKSVTGANTTITTGKTVTIDADAAFKKLVKSAGGLETDVANLGVLALASKGTTTGQDKTGLAAFSALTLLDVAGSYTVTVAMPTGAASSVTKMCFSYDVTPLSCSGGTLIVAGAKAINGKRDTNPGTTEYVWTFGNAGPEGTATQSLATSNTATILAEIDGSTVVDPGTFTIAVSGTYANTDFVAFPADVAPTTFSVWALGGLSVTLGPVLANSSTHLSVIRVNNNSATPGNVTVTVRDQATGVTKGTADSSLATNVPAGAAIQVVIGDILSAVGYTPSGVTPVLVDVRCTCSGTAAVLMLNPDGGFSNVGFTQN